MTASYALLMILLLTHFRLSDFDDDVAAHSIVRTFQPFAVYSTRTLDPSG